MTCRTVEMPGGARAIVCSRGQRPRRCVACRAPATKLCDHPKGRGACDAPICDRHATSVGPDLDHCPDHATQGRLLP